MPSLARHLFGRSRRRRLDVVAHVMNLDGTPEEYDRHAVARVRASSVDVPARRGRRVLADHDARIAEQEIRREVRVEHDRSHAIGEVERLADAVRVAAVVLGSHDRHEVAARDLRNRIAHERVARWEQEADHVGSTRWWLLGDEPELTLPGPEGF